MLDGKEISLPCQSGIPLGVSACIISVLHPTAKKAIRKQDTGCLPLIFKRQAWGQNRFVCWLDTHALPYKHGWEGQAVASSLLIRYSTELKHDWDIFNAFFIAGCASDLIGFLCYFFVHETEI